MRIWDGQFKAVGEAWKTRARARREKGVAFKEEGEGIGAITISTISSSSGADSTSMASSPASFVV